jgi:hypothetical protein
LHDLFLLLLAHALLYRYLILVDPLDAHDAALAVVLNLHLGQPFLLVDDLVLHAVLLFHLKIHMPLLLIVLTANNLRLFGLFLLGQEDSLLHFALLVLALFVKHVVLLAKVALPFVCDLIIVNFLQRIVKR